MADEGVGEEVRGSGCWPSLSELAQSGGRGQEGILKARRGSQARHLAKNIWAAADCREYFLLFVYSSSHLILTLPQSIRDHNKRAP